VRATFSPLSLVLPAILIAAASIQPARADGNTDRQAEIEMAFDQFTAAKTEDQRTTIIDFLQHFDRKLVAGALIDHIIASRTGSEATAYNNLVEALGPDGTAALLDRLAKTKEPVAKGKLIVALRHCQGDDVNHALAACLDDKRPVLFEVHGTHPRRICDLAYDELYLKLRGSYGLDAGPDMKDAIAEKTPIKARDALIARLQPLLAATPSPTPSASATPAKSGT